MKNRSVCGIQRFKVFCGNSIVACRAGTGNRTILDFIGSKTVAGFPFSGVCRLRHIIRTDCNKVVTGQRRFVFCRVGFFKLEPADYRTMRRIEVSNAVDLIGCRSHVKSGVVARVVRKGKTDVFKIIKADVLRRENIRTLGILVGSGHDKRVIHPRAGIHFGEFFLDLLANL